MQTLFTRPSSPTTSFFPHHLLLLPTIDRKTSSYFISFNINVSSSVLKQERERVNFRSLLSAGARRRSVGYDEDEAYEYGYNEEIGMLEAYSQSSRNEVLIVTAMVDSDEVEVIIFKGFSSCLSYSTSADPSRSVLPARAVIKSIDRVKGPFNPSNIEYIEKGLTWETFKNRINPN